MVSFSLLLTTLAGFAAAGYIPSKPGCGDIDVFFTGLPPYHPLVISQGFNPALVDQALRADAANIIKAGYNLRVVLMGPEQPISVLSNQLKGTLWEGTGIGYGVRGSQLQNLTLRLGETIDVYRKQAPFSYILFDYSPNSGLWAIQQQFPLSSNCTNSPGKNLGFEIFCDICAQPSSSVSSRAIEGPSS